MITRRKVLAYSSLVAMSPLLQNLDFLDERRKRKFKIGACDWSIGKSSNIEAFDVAGLIGLDGLMVNMGFEKNNMHLREKALQQAYLEASRKTKVKIASLAI